MLRSELNEALSVWLATDARFPPGEVCTALEAYATRYLRTAATATQRRWAAALDDPHEGRMARRALLLWCGDPLGLVVGASTDEEAR